MFKILTQTVIILLYTNVFLLYTFHNLSVNDKQWHVSKYKRGQPFDFANDIFLSSLIINILLFDVIYLFFTFLNSPSPSKRDPEQCTIKYIERELATGCSVEFMYYMSAFVM